MTGKVWSNKYFTLLVSILELLMQSSPLPKECLLPNMCMERLPLATKTGMLLCLSGNTCPKITFLVNCAARFMFCLKLVHKHSLKQIWHYLKVTSDTGLIMKPSAIHLKIDYFEGADFSGMYWYKAMDNPVWVKYRTRLTWECPRNVSAMCWGWGHVLNSHQQNEMTGHFDAYFSPSCVPIVFSLQPVPCNTSPVIQIFQVDLWKFCLIFLVEDILLEFFFGISKPAFIPKLKKWGVNERIELQTQKCIAMLSHLPLPPLKFRFFHFPFSNKSEAHEIKLGQSQWLLLRSPMNKRKMPDDDTMLLYLFVNYWYCTKMVHHLKQ